MYTHKTGLIRVTHESKLDSFVSVCHHLPRCAAYMLQPRHWRRIFVKRCWLRAAMYNDRSNSEHRLRPVLYVARSLVVDRRGSDHCAWVLEAYFRFSDEHDNADKVTLSRASIPCYSHAAIDPFNSPDHSAGRPVLPKYYGRRQKRQNPVVPSRSASDIHNPPVPQDAS